jgi:hypothetical protein
MEHYEAIPQKFDSKGWAIHERARDGRKLELAEIRARGPIGKLEEDISYLVWPRGYVFGDQEALEGMTKKHGLLDIEITVPSVPSAGRSLINWQSGREEYPLLPNQQVHFIGFTLQRKRVKLLSPDETYMPLEVFLEALDSLTDMTDRLNKE